MEAKMFQKFWYKIKKRDDVGKTKVHSKESTYCKNENYLVLPVQLKYTYTFHFLPSWWKENVWIKFTQFPIPIENHDVSQRLLYSSEYIYDDEFITKDLNSKHYYFKFWLHYTLANEAGLHYWSPELNSSMWD